VAGRCARIPQEAGGVDAVAEDPMPLATTDLSDAHPDVGHLDPVFRHYGGVRAFHGPARTVKVFEDNALVRSELEKPGEGAVLVVDGGGSLRCALLGGNLAALAQRNGFAGVIVFGCVRDTVEIGATPVGVLGLAAHPRKSVKRGAGEVGVPVTFAGATIAPGTWIYADDDGVLVAPGPIHGA
jgi:regulator of ribonuclease activity A